MLICCAPKFMKSFHRFSMALSWIQEILAVVFLNHLLLLWNPKWMNGI